MKFPSYPKYKDSGVEWLGEVPEHWEVKRVGMLTICLDGKRIPLNGEERSDRQGPYPYWGANGIVDHIDGWLVDGPMVLLGEDGAPFFDPYKPVAFYVNEKVWVNNHAHILRALPSIDPKLLTYALNQTQYGAFIDGSTRDKLTQSDMRNIPIVCPPISCQNQIIAFLDAQTAKLDTLIAKKRELIDKLKEKRAALITRTVTRGLPPEAAKAAGLDPNPRMKDSGVEWLGEVPEHWEVKRLKRLATGFKAGPFGSSLTKDMYVDSGFRVYGQEQVIPNNFSVGDYYIPGDAFNELKQYQVKAGDILISCVGTFGKIAVVPDGVEPGIINPRLIRVSFGNAAVPEYIAIVLRSDVVQGQLSLHSRGGTMDIINIGILSEIVISVPTREEQLVLASYLDLETAKLDALTAKVESAIERLQEYRSALITAAVTGKIDVREVRA